MNHLNRLRLFVRDYINEFRCAWSIAKMRDCERNGGHRWGAAAKDPVLGWGRTCHRCGCCESVPCWDTTAWTTASNAANYTVRF